MSRQEDFKKEAVNYVDGEPDGAQKIVGQVGFEFGAEHGFWYGAEETLHIVMQIYVKNNFTLPSNLEEIVREKLKRL